jgi:hypothetical protein
LLLITQFLGEVAAGVGRYRKADLTTRIKAAQIVLSYGYGSPGQFDGDNAGLSEEVETRTNRSQTKQTKKPF